MTTHIGCAWNYVLDLLWAEVYQDSSMGSLRQFQGLQRVLALIWSLGLYENTMALARRAVKGLGMLGLRWLGLGLECGQGFWNREIQPGDLQSGRDLLQFRLQLLPQQGEP